MANPVQPFLKWPGGKRWAAPYIAELLERKLHGSYFEPFLGGGAVFFQLRPARAKLSDINAELIDTYIAIRESPNRIVEWLQSMPVNSEYYDAVRVWNPTNKTERAARMLYLNRTAFAGLYRLNQSGGFNVPFGGGSRKPDTLWTTTLLDDAAAALENASLKTSDFGVAIGAANEGDVVYCDPTYTVAHDRNGFVRYNERNFSWRDQIRLAKAAERAQARGVFVVVSNAHHASIRALYPTAKVKTLRRSSRVCSNPKFRGDVYESLILLEPP